MRLLSIISLAFTTFCLSAQTNFKEGYILQKTTGDTLKGLINYKNWVYNPAFIEFKQHQNHSTTIYAAKDIEGFGCQGDIYEVFDIERPVYQRINKVFINSVKETVFLLALTKGKANLYELNIPNQMAFYFIQKDTMKIQYLVGGIEQSKKNGTVYVTEKKAYKGILKSFLTDCPMIDAKIINAQYNAKSLTNVVNSWNNCHSSTNNYVKDEEPATLRWGIQMGGSATYIKTELNEGKRWSMRPLIGVTLGYDLQRNRGKTSFNIDAQIQQYSFVVSNDFIKLDLAQTCLNSMLYVRHVLLTDRLFKPFITGGGSLRIPLITGRKLFTVNNTPTNYNTRFLVGHLMVGLGGQIGDKWAIEARGIYGSLVDGYVGIRLPLVQMSATYYF